MFAKQSLSCFQFHRFDSESKTILGVTAERPLDRGQLSRDASHRPERDSPKRKKKNVPIFKIQNVDFSANCFSVGEYDRRDGVHHLISLYLFVSSAFQSSQEWFLISRRLESYPLVILMKNKVQSGIVRYSRENLCSSRCFHHCALVGGLPRSLFIFFYTTTRGHNSQTQKSPVHRGLWWICCRKRKKLI